MKALGRLIVLGIGFLLVSGSPAPAQLGGIGEAAKKGASDAAKQEMMKQAGLATPTLPAATPTSTMAAGSTPTGEPKAEPEADEAPAAATGGDTEAEAAPEGEPKAAPEAEEAPAAATGAAAAPEGEPKGASGAAAAPAAEPGLEKAVHDAAGEAVKKKMPKLP